METALKIVQKLYTHKAVRLLTKKQKTKKALKSVRFLNNAIKKQFGTNLAIAQSPPRFKNYFGTNLAYKKTAQPLQ